MKPDSHEKSHKEYLKNYKRKRELQELIKTVPLIPLSEPKLVGWDVVYDLRSDIKERVDAFDIQQALDLTCTSQRIRNVKHVKMIRAGKKGYIYIHKGRRLWSTFCPEIHTISEKEYDLLPPQIRKWFQLDISNKLFIRYGRKYYTSNVPDYFLILRAKPVFHTHYEGKGGEIQREIDYLTYKINEYWQTAPGGGYRKSFHANKYRAKMRDKISKFKKGEIEDIDNDKIYMDYD